SGRSSIWILPPLSAHGTYRVAGSHTSAPNTSRWKQTLATCPHLPYNEDNNHLLLRIYFMDIEGTYTLQASAEEVWQCLMDTQVLRHAIPGVEQVERLDDYKHTITLHVKQTPLMGSYHGQVTIAEQHYPYYYTL